MTSSTETSLHLRLRQAQVKDAEEIYAVHTAAIVELCNSCYSEEAIRQWAGRQTPQQYIPWIEEQELTVATASAEGHVVGFGHLIRSNDSSSICQVKGLFVSPKWAKKGVGTALLQHLEHQARVQGYTRMFLKSSLNAEGFYERMGYSVDDPTCKHVQCDQSIQCILMSKNL